jgi:hypothetical protein
MVLAMRAGGMMLLFAIATATRLAHAQAAIEAVQYPAWLERAGQTLPLTPGTVLRPRDVILTGERAAAVMKLAEGSRVKLGENTRVILQRDELVVASGVFRFTASTARPLEVALRLSTVAIMSRGADLWGRGSDERAQVVLLGGRASVGAEGHGMVALERALDRYEMPRAGPPALGRALEGQLEPWLREAEMSQDGPIARPEGRWRVLVGKFESAAHASELERNVHAAGFAAEVTGGRERSPYMVVVPGMADEAAARAAMSRLRAIPGSGILSVAEADRPSR